MATLESVHDLQKSSQIEDKIAYEFLIMLLDSLFGQHDQIIIDAKCETEENHQLIRDHWKTISIYFKVPKRVKSIKKCVRQTIKNITDYLNNTYQFVHPVQFHLQKNFVRVGPKVIASCHTNFSLT
jgi:hypothetical protein